MILKSLFLTISDILWVHPCIVMKSHSWLFETFTSLGGDVNNNCVPLIASKDNPFPPWHAVSRAAKVILLGPAINGMSQAICIRWDVVKTLSNYRVSVVMFERRVKVMKTGVSLHVTLIKHLQLCENSASKGGIAFSCPLWVECVHTSSRRQTCLSYVFRVYLKAFGNF